MYEKLFVAKKDKDQDKHGVIATITMAELYAKQGYHDKAIKTCENILEKEPNNKKVSQMLLELRKKTSSGNIVKKNSPSKEGYKSGDTISTLHVWLGDITRYKNWREAADGSRAVSNKSNADETDIAVLEDWLQSIRLLRKSRAGADLNQQQKVDVDTKVSRLNIWLENTRKLKQTRKIAKDELFKSGAAENRNAKVARFENLLKLVWTKEQENANNGVVSTGIPTVGKDKDACIMRLQQWLNNIRLLRRPTEAKSFEQGNNKTEHLPDAGRSIILRLENWLSRIKRLRTA